MGEKDYGWKPLEWETGALRVFGKAEKQLFRCFGYNDEVSAGYLPGKDRSVVEIKARSIEADNKLSGFERRFFVSKSGTGYHVTMSGYVFNGGIGLDNCDDVGMVHVPKREDPLSEHLENPLSAAAEHLSLEEAMLVYESMVNRARVRRSDGHCL